MRGCISYSHEDRKVCDELRKPLKQLCRMDGGPPRIGIVLADLGLPVPGERQTRTLLAMALNHIIKDRRLKQAEAAPLLSVPQPKVSALVNYRLDGFRSRS